MTVEGCERWREAISALSDGEQGGLDPRLVEAHVARCPGCAAFRADVDRLGGIAPVRSDAGVPDLGRRVARRAAADDRRSRSPLLRFVLAAVAVEVIVLSLPELVLGEDPSTAGHASRHLGAFSVAYAVALLMVVRRPARARTILPVAAVLGGALLITAVVDVAEGRIPLVEETLHLPELLSVLLVWRLAVPAPSLRSDRPLGRSGSD